MGCQPTLLRTAKQNMDNEPNNPTKLKGLYKSNYLPHFDGGEIAQFVTYRLAGSLPKRVLNFYKQQLERDLISEVQYHEQIDKYLDSGKGADFLKLPKIALMVEGNLLRFHMLKYQLYAWVIMSNHVHLLFTPINGFSLASIIHSIKSYTSSEANKMLDRVGRFWARDYFDRYIRNEEHFRNTVDYINQNPVKARLCRRPEDWPFGSARLNRS